MAPPTQLLPQRISQLQLEWSRARRWYHSRQRVSRASPAQQRLRQRYWPSQDDDDDGDDEMLIMMPPDDDDYECGGHHDAGATSPQPTVVGADQREF